ncbi:MAG TPA: hypothetical protein VGE77_14575 [Nocardioides sp.]
MNRGGDEEAWRAIVENYGERAELEDTWDAAAGRDTTDPTDPTDPADPADDLVVSGGSGGSGDSGDPVPPRRELEERFVPPTPPPLPRPAPPRLAAWCGVLGMPVVVIVLIVLGVATPPWATTAMVLWFLGGFAYLVASMPGDRPDDGDNGARV